MTVAQWLFWGVNAGLPVGGVLLNVFVRSPRNIPVTCGSDLVLAIAMADLAMVTANSAMQLMFDWHPYREHFDTVLVLAAVFSLLGWLIMINYMEPKNGKRSGFGPVFGWLIVGLFFAAHCAFFFAPVADVEQNGTVLKEGEL